MATIPDPTGSLSEADQAIAQRMASTRAHAAGRAHLGDVYVRMFNNPGVAAKVGALGERLRFHGVLPDDLRETTILRFAYRMGFGSEWSHHLRPARLLSLVPTPTTLGRLIIDPRVVNRTLVDAHSEPVAAILPERTARAQSFGSCNSSIL